MGRDGTALLPSPRATGLLRTYPLEAESEIKIISMFSLFISNLPRRHGEKDPSPGYQVHQQQALLPHA